MTTTSADMSAARQRMQAIWASGDFSAVGARVTIVGELLCEAADLRAGERVLDVATGSGNTAIAAARRFCEVTGVDFVPALLERARERAAAERLPATFIEGDALHIPLPDGSFDVVMSTFGAMFAVDHQQAADELLRVCRPGGRIAMANWVPDGAVGALFAATVKHAPPPPGLVPPTRWGTEPHLRELFGDLDLSVTRRSMFTYFPSYEFFGAFFAHNFGPTLKAFEAVGPQGADALRADLLAAAEPFNVSGDETLKLRQDYVEVIVRKPS